MFNFDEIAEELHAQKTQENVHDNETCTKNEEICACKEIAPMAPQNPFDLAIAESKLNANSAHELLAKAKEFHVETEGQAKQGLEMAMQSRKIKDELERSRRKIVRPHLDFQKAVNSLTKDLTECLDKISKDLTKKVEKYQNEKKIRYEGAGIEIPPEPIKTETCTQYEKEVISIAVVDETLIPREYMSYNKKSAEKAVKLGVRSIPGLEIKVETKTIFKRK